MHVAATTTADDAASSRRVRIGSGLGGPRGPITCFLSVADSSWRSNAERSSNPRRSRLATNDYLHLRRVALSGEVVTELPPFLAEGPIREGNLVPVLEAHPMLGREVRAIVPETRWTSPLVRRSATGSASDAVR